MFVKKSETTHLLVLARGEEIIKNIVDYCAENKIASAWVSGLGALSEIDLAIYRLEKKQYFRQQLRGDFELLSLNGNIGQMEGKSIAHLHATISDSEMKAYGGHLDRAIVAATCEIKLDIIENDIERKFSDEIGLNLIER